MWGWRWRCLSYLDSRLAEVHPPGQLLPHEGVGVMRPLKDPLQSLQLAAVERGAVPPLLLLPLGHSTARAQALTWGKSQQKPRETPQNPASKDSVFMNSNEFDHETSQRSPIPINPRSCSMWNRTSSTHQEQTQPRLLELSFLHAYFCLCLPMEAPSVGLRLVSPHQPWAFRQAEINLIFCR